MIQWIFKYAHGVICVIIWTLGVIIAVAASLIWYMSSMSASCVSDILPKRIWDDWSSEVSSIFDVYSIEWYHIKDLVSRVICVILVTFNTA